MPSVKSGALHGRAKVLWPILIIAIIVAELVLGVIVYQTYDATTALIALCGVPALALVDYLARIRAGDERPRWYRRYLSLWCLVPFAAALAGSFWVHYQKRVESLHDVRELAIDLRQAISTKYPAKTWGTPLSELWACMASSNDCIPDPTDVLTTEELNAAVVELVAKRYATGSKGAGLEVRSEAALESLESEESRRFGELARVVGRDLRLACGDVALVYQRITNDTLLDFYLALAIQALFVLWIPVMLAVSIARAHRRDSHRGTRSISDSLHSRDTRILAEDQVLFVPRFVFGALLVLGTNYVFSPFGLKATYIMTTVDEHALPGHPSWVLWSTSFAAVPVLVVGFVGFLLYALITASQRFALDDLDDQTLISLLIRGLVVILLCFALSSSPMNETVSRIFVFIAGVFPLRALEALAKKVNIAIDPDFDGSVSSFDGLPSLDPAKVFALRSAGIQSTYDLAATPIDEIAERVRIDPRLLGRAVDRAILIDAMGLALARRLEPFAITSATELVALKDRMPPLVEVVETTPPASSAFLGAPADGTPGAPPPSLPLPSSPLREAAVRVAERLANDLRVAQVRAWLAGSSYFEELHLDVPTELVLRAAGFESPRDLLAMPLTEVAHRAHMDPSVLGLVIDRALLVEAVGVGVAQQLHIISIDSATNLLDHEPSQVPAIKAVLGESMSELLGRLSRDRRVAEARRWLACPTPANEPRTRPPTSPLS